MVQYLQREVDYISCKAAFGHRGAKPSHLITPDRNHEGRGASDCGRMRTDVQDGVPSEAGRLSEEILLGMLANKSTRKNTARTVNPKAHESYDDAWKTVHIQWPNRRER